MTSQIFEKALDLQRPLPYSEDVVLSTWVRFLQIFAAFAIFSTTITPLAQAIPTRSLIDRSDEVLGPQIHLIYVVGKDVQDRNWDTNGQIKKWVDQGQDWFFSASGKKFRYDTFNSDLDISFLRSQLTLSEMRTGANSTIYDSKLLPYLVKEFITQSPQKNYASAPKTYIFVTSESIDPSYCGFASGTIGGIVWTGNKCWNGPQDDSTSPYGMSWPARTIIHEAIHTYGVSHACDSTSDLMWGVPECQGSITYGPTILDLGGNDYFGAERAGVDISRLPIWLDSPTTSAYSTLKAIKTYAPYSLASNASKEDWIFVVGKESTISWDWERIDGPQIGNLMECTLSNGKASITAKVIENQCVFAIPLNWRGGVVAVATGKIWAGPYTGSVTENIKLWNPENEYSACMQKYCFVGESLEIASNYCYFQDHKTFTLQQFVDGQWKSIATSPTRPTNKCKESSWEPVPVKYNLAKVETFTYRWVESDSATSRGFIEPVKTISVLASDADYPVSTKKEEIDKAATELAAAAAKKAEEDRIARELYSRQLDQCATSATNCYVGESFVAPSLCFREDIGEIQLEILNGTTWEVLTQGKVAPAASGCSANLFGTPAFSIVFQEAGVKVLRWRVLPNSKYFYTSSPYGILITDKALGEPKSIDLAQAKAEAEAKAKEAERIAAEAAAKAAAEAKAKAEAEAAAKAEAEAKAKEEARIAAEAAAKAAKKKVTITCIKGKAIKKVTGVKPVCPKGYVKKKS